MNPSPREPLALDLLLTADQRRPLTVAGHHEWRESLVLADSRFDEVDELVAALRETQPEENES